MTSAGLLINSATSVASRSRPRHARDTRHTAREARTDRKAWDPQDGATNQRKKQPSRNQGFTKKVGENTKTKENKSKEVLSCFGKKEVFTPFKIFILPCKAKDQPPTKQKETSSNFD
ncbi:hypothetical protein BaRGS_00031853 [Batillaria attramentaria]|uniref:Uncharacterized protein n=1 Tax=Batillaria attramentaria TaxID=370345 RepID=A0ABD0JPH7_9CAEN